MPQMAPIWWTSLFLMFIFSYIIYMMIMYFSTKYNISHNKKYSLNLKNMNWMW